MSTEEPRLGKSLFGYARSAVARILADREIMLRQAEGAVRDAETKASELEDELEDVRQARARLDEQMEQLGEHVDVPRSEEASSLEDSEDALQLEAVPVEEDEEIPVFSDPISMWDAENTVSEEAFSAVDMPGPASRGDSGDSGDALADDTSALWAPAQYAAASVRGPEDQAPPQRAPEPSWFSGYDVESNSAPETQGASDISDVIRDDAVSDEPAPTRRPEVTSSFSEELAGILAAAEESAAGIVERARVTTERQITESTRLWREVEAEVARFSSWREQVEPVIRRIASKVDDVRVRIEEVPERIREALAPMADGISSLDADMAELAAATTPPLLLKPSGLDERESEVLQSREREEQFAQAASGSNSGGSGPKSGGGSADSEYRAESTEDVTEG
jgi:hypothetical protein